MTGTMLDVKVNRDDPALLHEQVAAQIRRAIADGEAKPGDRLPPARHLAAVMQVNTNTVLRALRLASGQVIADMTPRHRTEEFRRFLNTIDAAVPAHLQVHVVLDNSSTHKTPSIQGRALV
jgi:DNA-binding transcriptional MocR family regulator